MQTPLKLFITGTDTGVGKTHISIGLLNHFNQHGLSTLGIKPIATACTALRNADAFALQRVSSIKLNYQQINPIAFAPAIAPHIAAAQVNYPLSVRTLLNKCHLALTYPADVCVVEGVGGWRVPLNEYETMADFVKQSSLKVVLVVGMRLGCLNHAILTYEAMQHDQVSILGWIANCIDPHMLALNENIATLQKWFPMPCWAIINYAENLRFFSDRYIAC